MARVSRSRRRFTPEFKVEAVRLMRERLAAGLTLERVSRELEIGPDLLRVWAQQVAAHPGARAEEIFPGPGARRTRAAATPAAGSPETELRRLQREVEVLRQERDFLKKAAAFFAKESR